MPQITFRGAVIRYADLRFKDEAGKFTRLHMTADYSDPVRERMGWVSIPPSVQSAKLDGQLTAHNMILTPAAKELKSQEMQIECSEVSDFEVVRVKNADGESSRTELRFIARSVQADAAARVEQYFATVGHAAAQLKVTHQKQEGLDFTEPEEQSSLDMTSNEAPEPVLASVTAMPDMEERRKARQQRREPATQAAAKPSNITEKDWNREQQEDPNVPHLVPGAVQ